MVAFASPERGWYLVYTKPKQENLALDNLRRQGYVSYLPLARSVKRRGGARRTLVEPLFRRYLFIELTRGRDDWGPIRSTYGVSGLVSFGNEPARIPTELVEAIRQRESVDGYVELGADEPKLGAEVRITEGVMHGYRGRLLSKNSQERVMVLLEVANKMVRVQLPLAAVQAVVEA